MTSNAYAGGRPRRNTRSRPVAATRTAASRPASPPEPAIGSPAPGPSFAELGVPLAIVSVLATAGATVPFAIQSAALPDALAGRDVLGRAQTGSGKTIAFAVPLAVALTAPGYQRAPGRPGALVLVPTRELAAQVARTVAPIATAVGLRCATVHGGVPQGPQVAALRSGADIVVATPGRLEDLIAQKRCSLERVKVTVLDEADQMADLGFLPAVARLLDQTPPRGQRLLFSATLDQAITELAARYLHDPAAHAVDPEASSPERLDHHVLAVQPSDKAAVVAELARGATRGLFFTRTKHGARKLAHQLRAAGAPAAELHANLSQRQRERNLDAFAAGSVRVLVATDIAARGIHVDDVSIVVHVDPPEQHKTYLHRSGRTARAGAAGTVVTIAAPAQVRGVIAMLRKAGLAVRPEAVVPGDDRLASLTGVPSQPRARLTPVLPRPAPGPRVDAPARQRRPHGRRRPQAASGRTAGAPGTRSA